MTKMKLLAVASAMALSLSAAEANAAITISGTGTWGASTATTAYSAPNATFSFSFSVPDAFTASGSTASTTAITNASYKLNGLTVSGAPTGVTFWDTSNSGMFDLKFASTTINVYGADIGSDGTVGPNGSYTITAGVNSGSTTAGTGTVTVGAMAAVPEPASWAMMIVGAGMVGGALRRRRRSATSVSVRYA